MDRFKVNWRAWAYFLIALVTLTVALLLALASQVASVNSQGITAALLAILALGLAAIIALTIVPYLARRVRGEWFRVRLSYKITREGMIYFGVTVLLGLSAVNTGNNLLFIILAAMLASIIISGVASRIALTGLTVMVEFPERIFAGQPALAMLTLTNHKRWLPSFSVNVSPNKQSPRVIHFDRAYFPFLGPSASEKRKLEIRFDRRGRYEQSALRISTRFPFGFILKSMDVPQEKEIIVFPTIGSLENEFEILPLISGEFESYSKGRGMDLYALRDYAVTDSARMIHWKASAHAGNLKVKEYSREDERRLVLVFDYMTDEIRPQDDACFERAVSLCAGLAEHFFEEGADLNYLMEDGTLLEGQTETTLDQIFTELALIEMKLGASRLIEQMNTLPQEEKDSFKIVFTLRHRGTLPTPLWQSSHVLFIRECRSYSGNPRVPGEIKTNR